MICLHTLRTAIYYNIVEPLQNNSIPNSTTGNPVDAPTQLLYSSDNDFPIRESIGYDNSAYAPSNQSHYKGNLETDAYLGYNGNVVGQYNMEYDEFINAPQKFFLWECWWYWCMVWMTSLDAS